MKVYREADGWWFAEARDRCVGMIQQGAGTTRNAAKRRLVRKLRDWKRARERIAT